MSSNEHKTQNIHWTLDKFNDNQNHEQLPLKIYEQNHKCRDSKLTIVHNINYKSNWEALLQLPKDNSTNFHFKIHKTLLIYLYLQSNEWQTVHDTDT